MYRFIESITLLLGAIALIGARSGDAITSSVPLLVAIVVVQCANIVIGYIFGPYARQKNLAVRQALGRMYGFALDTFTHIRTVVSLQMEARMSRDYLFYCVDYFRRSFTLNSATKLLTGFTLSGSLLIRFFALYGGALLIFSELKDENGETEEGISAATAKYSIGDLFALLLYVDMLRSAAKNAIDQYARIMASLGSVERVIALHDRGVIKKYPQVDFGSTKAQLTKKKVKTRKENKSIELLTFEKPFVWDDSAKLDTSKVLTGAIELCDVHFNYKSKAETAVLRGASISIASGEVVLITGASGSGKSTLLACAQLMQRPFKGGISFGFKNGSHPIVHELEHDFYTIQRQISSVGPTTSDVFHASVEDNVAAGMQRPVSSSEIRSVCTRVGLHKYIMGTKDGYRQRIGDGSGIALSSGQKSQLALARALLRKPAILILDEASAHLDSSSQALFFEAIKMEAARGCSILAVSHLPKRFTRAIPTARVVTLRGGKIELP